MSGCICIEFKPNPKLAHVCVECGGPRNGHPSLPAAPARVDEHQRAKCAHFGTAPFDVCGVCGVRVEPDAAVPPSASPEPETVYETCSECRTCFAARQPCPTCNPSSPSSPERERAQDELAEKIQMVRDAQKTAADFWKVETRTEAAGFYRGQAAAYGKVVEILERLAASRR